MRVYPNCPKCNTNNVSDESFWYERPMQSYFHLVCNCGFDEGLPIDKGGNIVEDWYNKKERKE